MLFSYSLKILIYAILLMLSHFSLVEIILKSLEYDTKMLLRWFNLNLLGANPEKVSAYDFWEILMGKAFTID